MQNRTNHLANLFYFIAICAAIQFSESFINPILLSIVFAIILRPIIKALSRLHFPFGLSLLVVLFVIICILTLVGGIVANTVNQFTNNIELITATAIEKFKTLNNIIQPILEDWGITYSLRDLTDNFDPTKYTFLLKSLFSSLTGIMSQGFFILLTVVFILLDADLLEKHLQKIYNNRTDRLAYVSDIHQSIAKYIEKKFVISLVTAIFVYIAMEVCNVQFALMWSCLTLLFNFIPNIGVFIVSAPMILQSYILQDFTTASIFSAILVIIHFLSGNVFEPRIMSKYLNLNTLVVWISLIFWNYLLGPVGMLLSIPLTATFKIILEKSIIYRNLALLMEGENLSISQEYESSTNLVDNSVQEMQTQFTTNPESNQDLDK